MERFFYEVHDVPLFTSRVHALRARQTFAAQACYLVITPPATLSIASQTFAAQAAHAH